MVGAHSRACIDRCDNRAMEMGNLFEYPLDPTVWGTVAAWVGALGSSAAFLLAAQVFRRDARLRRTEQAMMVRIEEKGYAPLGILALNPQNLILEVHNTSEKYIYSVTGYLRPRSLYESARGGLWLGPSRDTRRVSDEELQERLKDYRKAWDDMWQNSNEDRIAPGESATLKFAAPYTAHRQLVVEFTDAQNQRWQIRDDRDGIFTGNPPRLTYVSRRQARMMRLVKISSHLLTPPHKVIQHYREKIRLRRWAKKNSAWGPGIDGWKQKNWDASPRGRLIKDEPGEPVDFNFMDLDYSQNEPDVP